MKPYKLTFLLDPKNLWIKPFLLKYNFNLKNKFIISFSSNYKKVNKQDLVFIMNYTKILPESFLKKNKECFIAHESKLPKYAGFAPVANQVLDNKKVIYISIIKAEKKVDTGDIYLTSEFKLSGNELSDELRKKQAVAKLRLIKNFLKKFPYLNPRHQTGVGSFKKRRTYNSNKININKSLKSQFNILRIADNEKYPAYFIYKNCRYILKIYKA